MTSLCHTAIHSQFVIVLLKSEFSTISQYHPRLLNCSSSGHVTLKADERNGLRVDVNGNPNYEPEPGMPSTPPPSYSVIERQTSYVSHISVSSSQSK